MPSSPWHQQAFRHLPRHPCIMMPVQGANVLERALLKRSEPVSGRTQEKCCLLPRGRLLHQFRCAWRNPLRHCRQLMCNNWRVYYLSYGPCGWVLGLPTKLPPDSEPVQIGGETSTDSRARSTAQKSTLSQCFTLVLPSHALWFLPRDCAQTSGLLCLPQHTAHGLAKATLTLLVICRLY